MNEVKRGNILIIVTIVLALILFLGQKENSNSEKKVDDKDALTALKTTKAQNKYNLIYLGRPTCSWCAKLQPILDAFEKEYNLDYLYINTDNLDATGLDNVLAELGKELSTFGTPYLVITKNGEVVKDQPGYVPPESLFTFLQENNILDKEAKFNAGLDYEAEATFKHTNAISTGNTMTDLKSAINSDEKVAVYLGRPTCSYCAYFEPILMELKGEGLSFHYVNTDEITSDEFSEILTMIQKESQEFGTPYVAIFQNGKLYMDGDKPAENIGATEYESTKAFFQKYGIMK